MLTVTRTILQGPGCSPLALDNAHAGLYMNLKFPLHFVAQDREQNFLGVKGP